MVKLSVRFAWGAIIAVLLISTLALVVGRFIDTYAVTAQFAHSPNFTITGRNGNVVLIDLKRSLRAGYQVPFENIANIDFWGASHDLFVTTRDDDPQHQRYERGFHIHNMLTGETNTLVHYVSDRFPVPDTSYYSRAFSGDMGKLAFYEPVTQTLYVYDFINKEKISLWTFEDGPVDANAVMNWSSDGEKLAVTARFSENLVYVFDLEGTTPTILPTNERFFNLWWTEDDQYLFLQNFEYGRNTPVHLISITDGTEHPYTVDLEATSVNWWGCESRWVSYVVIKDRFREGYILDLQTGEKVRMNDHPLLQNQEIDYVLPRQNCESFLVFGFIGNSRGLSQQMQPIYYADANFQNVQLIDEAAATTGYGQSEENTLYYYKDDPNTQRTTIYKRTLDPLSEPTNVMEYDLIEGWTQWAEDRSFMTYTESSGGRNNFNPYSGKLVFYDPYSGEKRYLTHEGEYLAYYILYRWQQERG